MQAVSISELIKQTATQLLHKSLAMIQEQELTNFASPDTSPAEQAVELTLALQNAIAYLVENQHKLEHCTDSTNDQTERNNRLHETVSNKLPKWTREHPNPAAMQAALAAEMAKILGLNGDAQLEIRKRIKGQHIEDIAKAIFIDTYDPDTAPELYPVGASREILLQFYFACVQAGFYEVELKESGFVQLFDADLLMLNCTDCPGKNTCPKRGRKAENV